MPLESPRRASPTRPLACRSHVGETSQSLAAARATRGLAYYLRVLRVVGAIDFKARYTDAALGYVWSLVKPLAYFGVLWLVFAHLLKTANLTDDFPLFLLIGLLLFIFFIDSVSAMLPSIVKEGATLRRLAFDPILIPLSASVAIVITFCLNVLVFVVFAAIERVSPRIEWLLVAPLLVELYLFIVGLGLLLSALYVRFRDIEQVWELATQLLFFAVAIFYPIGILPDWAQKVAFLNPFVQVMQDVRHAVFGGSSGPNDVTAGDVYAGAGGRLIPILMVLFVFLGALFIFRREGRYFAERL
jgi:ABC-2 type transport system permease protein